MIGKLRGIIDSYGEDWVILDVGGVGYVVHCSARTLAGAAAGRRGGDARDRDPCARGPDPPLRLHRRPRARMVPPAADRAGRRHQGRARHPLDAEAGRARDAPSRCGDKATVARAPGVGPKVAAAHRRRTEGQGAGLSPTSTRPWSGSQGDLGDRRAPQPGRRRGLGAGQSRLWPGAGRPRPIARRAARGGRGRRDGAG